MSALNWLYWAYLGAMGLALVVPMALTLPTLGVTLA